MWLKIQQGNISLLTSSVGLMSPKYSISKGAGVRLGGGGGVKQVIVFLYMAADSFLDAGCVTAYVKLSLASPVSLGFFMADVWRVLEKVHSHHCCYFTVSLNRECSELSGAMSITVNRVGWSLYAKSGWFQPLHGMLTGWGCHVFQQPLWYMHIIFSAL